jgi:hypothetical protein
MLSFIRIHYPVLICQLSTVDGGRVRHSGSVPATARRSIIGSGYPVDRALGRIAGAGPDPPLRVQLKCLKWLGSRGLLRVKMVQHQQRREHSGYHHKAKER